MTFLDHVLPDPGKLANAVRGNGVAENFLSVHPNVRFLGWGFSEFGEIFGKWDNPSVAVCLMKDTLLSRAT